MKARNRRAVALQRTPPAKLPEVVTVELPAPQGSSLAAIGGSPSDDFNTVLANQVVRSLWRPEGDGKDERNRKNQAAIAALIGIKPASELEGMIAAQLIALHNAAMECFRRAMIPEQPAQYQTDNLAQGIKASRAGADLLLALDKHRGKGAQHVTVEHVHIHQGGQAIVGAVATGAVATGALKPGPVTTGGPGVEQNPSDRPHAPASNAAAKSEA